MSINITEGYTYKINEEEIHLGDSVFAHFVHNNELYLVHYGNMVTVRDITAKKFGRFYNYRGASPGNMLIPEVTLGDDGTLLFNGSPLYS